MESFQNDQIFADDLPNFETVIWQPISARYKTVVWFNLIVGNTIALLAVVSSAYFLLLEWSLIYFWAAIALAVLLAISISYLTLIAFHRKGFALRTHDAMYRSGIVSEMQEIIPYNRLQHVVVKQGWLSRSLGLARVKMYTAASGGSISIPGILVDEAEKIKHLLLDKITHTDLEDSESTYQMPAEQMTINNGSQDE